MQIALIRMTLLLLESGGVTAPEQGVDEVHLPLARDGAGGPWYPPTSVAGSLRRLLGEPDAARLMGTEDGHVGRASAIRVLGTRVRPGAGRGPARRVRNAMDRCRGAPRATFLFSSEVLPAGAAVEVRLRWDDPAEADLEMLLAALRTWCPVLGRGGSIRQGRCRVAAIGTRVLDLGDDDDLLDWLSIDGPSLFDAIAVVEHPEPARPELLLDVRWYLRDALHVGGADDESAGELPRVSRVLTEGGECLVPGSTWKGVLRARCEYILRSVGVGACQEGSCGRCRACELFGWGAPRREDDDPSAGGGCGPLRFLSCTVEPDPRHGLGAPHLVQRQHVALDRVTGGAHRGLLYTEEVLTSGAVRLRVESDPARTVPAWARGLLLAVVGDLADGLVGIGGGTTRGNGTLERAGQPGLTAAEQEEVRAALRALSAGPSVVEQPA